MVSVLFTSRTLRSSGFLDMRTPKTSMTRVKHISLKGRTEQPEIQD